VVVDQPWQVHQRSRGDLCAVDDSIRHRVDHMIVSSQRSSGDALNAGSGDPDFIP
jgi:hypothetical protein